MSDHMKVSEGQGFPVVALPGAGVLCGGDKGCAEVGDWEGWKTAGMSINL